MHCPKCNQELDSYQKIHFRDTCPKCSFDLHTCKMCRFYQVGKPNDCLIPMVDLVQDKEKFNYCEDFKPILDGYTSTKRNPSISDIEKKLFD